MRTWRLMLVKTGLWVLLSVELLAQIPSADFTHLSTICQEQNIELINNSTNGISYEWDFCEGDLLELPVASNVLTISDASSPRYFDLVQENSIWYGFVTSRDNHSILRLTFGPSLDNTPSVENLGNVSGLLNKPEPIVVLEDDGSWYAMIHNGGNNSIARVSFGASLANAPIATIAMENIGESNSRMEFIQTSTGFYALLSYWNSNTIDIVDFDNSLNNNPTSDNVLTTSSISEATNIIDISLIESEGNWYGLLVAYGSKTIHTLEFGLDLYSDPVASNVTSTHAYGYNPYSVDLEIDNGRFIGFMSSIGGKLVQLNFGESITDGIDSSQDLGDLTGITQNTWSIVLRKENSNWFGFSVDGSKKNLYKIAFPNNCYVDIETSNDIEPNPIFSATGSYNIGLKVINNNFQTSRSISPINITSNTAPTISFTDNANECATQPNTFTPSSDGSITNYQWEVDEMIEQNGATAEFTFALGDTDPHQIKLTIDDGTCTNTLKDSIMLYPAPITPTYFTSGTPYCTGADIAFTNLFDETDFNGATLTYSWDYNGEGVSTDRNGSFNFNTESSKTVTLTASIPGCSTSSAEPDLDLIAGPLVDFSFADKCLGDQTEFTNLTTGQNITGQSWQFGDGNGTTDISPSYEYEDAGDYNVSLAVTNSAGCNNTAVIPITIDDRPEADFIMGVGCEGQLVGFEDLSTVNDANIVSYAWDFAGEGSASEQDPTYTFATQGTYPITLTVASTYGCENSETKNINVQLAPEADFMVDLGCLNATTQFVDQTTTESENPINSWYWDINGDITPNTQNPSEVFSTPGVYSATLTVTPSNLCVSTISKDFTIHELPVADFTTDNRCDNEFTLFTDASTSATTTIVTYNWQFDEEGSGNSNPASFNFSQAGEYEVSLNIIDEIGCESNILQTTTINPSPTANYVVNRDIGPAPLIIDFTNESTGSSSYFWKFNDPANTTSTDQDPQFVYTELGDYKAELISSNDFGCSDTTSQTISVADPVLDLELVQLSKEESSGRTNISLTARNNGNVAIRNFDIRIDLDNNSSIYESYTGTLYKDQIATFQLNFSFSSANNNIGYTCITLIDLEEEHEDVNLVNNEGCIDFAQKLIVENSYPNPIGGGDSKIRLNMILPSKAPVQIFLMDATGAVLYQEVYSNTNTGLNSFFVDVYSYRNGMYLIKVIYDQTETTQRFVKM